MANESIRVVFEPLGSFGGVNFYHETLVYTNSAGQSFLATSYASNSSPSGSQIGNLSEASSAVNSGSSSAYGTLVTQWGPESGLTQAELDHWLGPAGNPYPSKEIA